MRSQGRVLKHKDSRVKGFMLNGRVAPVRGREGEGCQLTFLRDRRRGDDVSVSARFYCVTESESRVIGSCDCGRPTPVDRSSAFSTERSTRPRRRNSTVQYSTVQYSTVQYSTVQYSTVQYWVWGREAGLKRGGVWTVVD